MNYNSNNYKGCTYCNNVNGAWGFHWKHFHKEWKVKEVRKKSVRFYDCYTNEMIYFS